MTIHLMSRIPGLECQRLFRSKHDIQYSYHGANSGAAANLCSAHQCILHPFFIHESVTPKRVKVGDNRERGSAALSGGSACTYILLSHQRQDSASSGEDLHRRRFPNWNARRSTVRPPLAVHSLSQLPCPRVASSAASRPPELAAIYILIFGAFIF